MSSFSRRYSKNRSVYLSLAFLAAMVSLALVLASCNGTGTLVSSAGTGTVRVSITDPPSCAYPNGDFQHVYVTIRSVQANISATAGDNSPGWQELAPQLNSQPVQIDLFANPIACLLTTLGSNTALRAGTYQQIRLLLVPNNGGSGPLPVSNACKTHGYNCVVLHDGSIHEIALSSQANTGLKIPPGQIEGGPITVAAGQDVDLNIDFNVCASIIQQSGGRYRLKPVLTAQQVGANNTGISGHVVDSVTKLPIAGGTVLVAVEQPDKSGTDVIVRETAADASGNFNFCPLLTTNTFDVVVVAVNGAGVAYNATVAVGVPGGTDLGAIPLVAETGSSTGPATLQGYISASTGTGPANVDAAVSALQKITLSGGATRDVTMPAEAGSTSNVSTSPNNSCPATASTNTYCAEYTLVEPASNPSVGTFSAGSVMYAAPPSGDVDYSVAANAFVPNGGGLVDCTPPSQTVTTDTNGQSLKVMPSSTVTPQEIDFKGCQ